ncbi:chemotaxis protein CheC [Heliophilum fasciatum]|uniref:Chemotaxis protein CheC n=1 Tax=Heliophilum fasciatum TaxID=35700 RepID=A0A4R2RW98_9FIRM|nr:chemotaxis protein CheC [Heliophilum fasciatum]MCW2277423.1 chemotaxis protein CheC [Heliophilum fasciatum]TCP67259.1 chemotaxis protein CheC [Heliophilum fasciatum]
MNFLSLTPMQMDALREVGNVGAGNAATALSEMVGRAIDMNVPALGIVPFCEVSEHMGGAETLVAGVYICVTGEAPASMLFVLPLDSACGLVDMLMGRPIGTTVTIGEMEESALKEIGNILTGTYLRALSMFTQITFEQSVPALAIDMAEAINSVVLAMVADVGDHALLLETEFKGAAQNIKGSLFLIPQEGTLEKILASLGLA